jgi:hypothetical protein
MRAFAGLLALAITSTAAAQPRGICAGQRCSGHGECVEEVDEAYCFCDEGYEAVAMRCVPSPRPAAIPVRTTSTGSRIVGIAIAERGRELSGVGRGSTEPGPLGQFIRPSSIWCSDFVSWVYRAAGVPFTGGYQGGWLLTNNVAIRRWFVRRDAWISRRSPDWRTFQPRPGDYVRIHTRTWGHSAIVRYVDGDTLHTIEGNAGGRVITTTYPRFRDYERIDGFGLTTLPEARRLGIRVAAH